MHDGHDLGLPTYLQLLPCAVSVCGSLSDWKLNAPVIIPEQSRSRLLQLIQRNQGNSLKLDYITDFMHSQ